VSIGRRAVRLNLDRHHREELAMRFMLLLYVNDRPEPDTPGAAEAYPAIMAFHRECQKRGVLVAADPLRDPGSATTVRRRGGRTLVTDGPFAETREWLGGYFLLDCRDRDEALELAELCPVSDGGSVEVRPLLERS
jgi:hypothetical protein